MKPNYLILSFAWLVLFTCSCKESKSTATDPQNESQSATVQEGEAITQESPENMEMINADETINATLECNGSSELSTLIIAAKKRETKNFTCHIVNTETLTIVFEDKTQGMTLTIELFGAGSLPIKKGNYGNKTTNANQYAIASLKSKALGTHDLGAFTGTIEIRDYGMSSNIVCGSFDLTDTKGNKYIGTFNEMVSDF